MSAPPPRQRSWWQLLAGVAVAGGVGWIVDTTLLWVLDTRLGVPTALAAALGFLASGVVNFLINRMVFHGRSEPSRGQLLRYVALFLVNLAVVSALVPILAHLAGHVLHSVTHSPGIRLVAAKLVTTAALLPLNAVAYHRWVFVAPPVAPAGDTVG